MSVRAKNEELQGQMRGRAAERGGRRKARACANCEHSSNYHTTTAGSGKPPGWCVMREFDKCPCTGYEPPEAQP